MGIRRRAIARAIDALEGPGLRVLRRASLYETEPVGVEDQPWFLNTVVAVTTALPPRALMARCQGIERQLGRVTRARWGPREIDVDILLYGGWVIREPALVVPHPQLAQRGFVLVPLLELAADGLDPSSGRPLAALAAALPNTRKVEALRKKS